MFTVQRWKTLFFKLESRGASQVCSRRLPLLAAIQKIISSQALQDKHSEVLPLPHSTVAQKQIGNAIPSHRLVLQCEISMKGCI